jgi:sodium transport system ATP-binding protein
MIRVTNINKNFGQLTALQDVSCEFRDGEITGLLGLNGAGKTTLLRLMYGLLQPTAGTILVNDQNVQDHAQLIRRSLGVLPDDAGLYKRLTARENIHYFGELQGMQPDELAHQANTLIELLGMQDIAERPAEGFSLGERMKTALARTIVHQPQHILLDEPTNGLDVITTRAVRKLLLTLRDQGRCVIFSSHLMHEVRGLCDRVIVIARGRVVAQGCVEEVIAQAGCTNLEDAFVHLSQTAPVASS